MKKQLIHSLAFIVILSFLVQPIPTFAKSNQVKIPDSSPKSVAQTPTPFDPDNESEDQNLDIEIEVERQHILEEHLREEGLPEELLSHEYSSNLPEEREYVPPSDEIIAQTKAQVDSFSCADVIDVPESECEALVALYESANGAGWSSNYNWLVSNTVNNWYGIVVESGHVTTISFIDGNNLVGNIPSELGNLSNLYYFNLCNNQLSGSIPPELGNLSNLSRLELFYNQLSGSIPPELGNLNNLYYFDMRNNQLSGSIPPELGNLSNLQNLDLYDNQLSGSIPPELGNLSNLQNLYLSHNQLSGSIPPELGNLSNLRGLDLQFNQLSGSIPPVLGDLSNLVYLNLMINPLSGSIPPELGNLSNLWYLWLSYNQLSGSIPPELGNLSNLEALNLSHNQLSGRIPPELGNLSNLDALYLYHNQLSDSIPLSFTNLTRLNHFIFHNTYLCEPNAPEFLAWKGTVDIWEGTGIICEIHDCTGTVYSENGSGLPDVTIVVDSTISTTTDVNGFYSIQLMSGNYNISASKEGYIFSPSTLYVTLYSDRYEQNFIGKIAICEPDAMVNSNIQQNVCQMPISEPFLYLPIRDELFYDPSTTLTNWDKGGIITSWFDHNKPTYIDTNGKVMLSDGVEYPTNKLYFYDGHDGIDMVPLTPQDYAIVPAASGTIIDVCHRDSFHFPDETCDNYPTEGKYILISHQNNSYATLYGHLASIEDWVTKGKKVYRNDFSCPVPMATMGCSGMTTCAIHLHFTVFFNHYAEDPWYPTSYRLRSALVVDPFGWRPINEDQGDSWSIPSVWLWKIFQPKNVILNTDPETITLGSITANIPASSEYVGNLISFSPSTFYNYSIPENRSLGKAFSLQLFPINPVLLRNEETSHQASLNFTDPIDVEVNLGEINLHFDESLLSFYHYDSSTNLWELLPTVYDPVSSSIMTQVYPTGFFDIQAPLICPNDITEPSDDKPSQKFIISIPTSGITLARWFDIQEDVDWFAINVIAGITYTIQTKNLANGVDTILTIYNQDGITSLVSDDNSGGGLSSKLEFIPTESGIYFVNVSQGSGSKFGCESAYEVQIENNMMPIFLPLITR
jgi:Leucine-rich repeat (LRR) protein/murein DD-endopeptidase MepM/ murein hydrolase activator NlpD